MKIKNSNPHKYRAGVGDDGSGGGGGGGCQLKRSRLGGGSLDLVFNLAVLSPGRLAKVTEQ